MESREENIITKYLTGTSPDERDIKLYRQALAKPSPGASLNQDRLWNIIIKPPAFLPYIDAGLGILEPRHPLRLRIYILLAILETNPRYAKIFLLNFLAKSKPLIFIQCFYKGLTAFMRVLIGICIVKTIILMYHYIHEQRA